MINILLTSALIKNGNRGCVALTVSALYLIDEIMKERGIEYRIYLPDSGYNDTQKRSIFTFEYYSCLNINLRNLVKSFKNISKLKAYLSNKKIM